jgi:outer membrane protein
LRLIRQGARSAIAALAFPQRCAPGVLYLPILLSDNSGMLRRFLLAGVIALAAAPAHAQEIKIGYVDLTRLENESVQGQRAMAALKEEFAPRQQEILDLQRQIADERARFESERETLPKSELPERWKPIAEMMKKSDRLVFATREDMRLRRDHLMADVHREVRAAVKTVSEAEKFDLVLLDATFRSRRIDITDQVLAEMAKRATAGGQ